MKITAIILDGFHKGHVIRGDYMPMIKLIKPRNITVDYCCDGSSIMNNEVHEYEEYIECFRSVDKEVVLYSKNGNSRDIISQFMHVVSTKPWNENTKLYFGYHSEPIVRKDDGTQMTEYEKGFEQGIMEGRVLQEKYRNKHHA